MGFLNWLLQDDDAPKTDSVKETKSGATPDDDSILDRFTPQQLGRAIHRQTVSRGCKPPGRPPGSKNRPKAPSLLPGERPDSPAPPAAAAVLALLLSLGLLGCSTGQTSGVPTTRINLGHGVTAEFPKQVTVSNLTVRASNGLPVYVHADWIQSVNDPSVVEQSGKADAYRLDAMFRGMGTIAGEAVGAAVKGTAPLPASVPGK